MKLNLYTRENCEHCAQVVIPEQVIVNSINLDKDYGGFIPPNVPVMQYDGLSFEGPVVINQMLQLVKNAQDGYYKR